MGVPLCSILGSMLFLLYDAADFGLCFDHLSRYFIIGQNGANLISLIIGADMTAVSF